MIALQFTKRWLLPGFLLLLAVSGPACADDKQALEDLLDRFMVGASENHTEIHDRFWDRSLVYTSAAGERFGKGEIMAGLEENDEDSDDSPVYSAEDVQVNLFEDTAVVTFRLVAEWEDGSEESFFNTGVFRRFQDQWRAITWQATRAAEPSEG